MFAGTTMKNSKIDELLSKKKYKEVVKILSQQCKAKNMASCNMLGVLYYKGLGVKKDYTKAEELWKKACMDKNNGNGDACSNLGYYETKGTMQDRALKAPIAYEFACDKNNAEGCFSYGAYLERSGQYDEAIKIYKKACKLGSKEACYMVKVRNQSR